MAHNCPVRGCPLNVKDLHLMCRAHWAQVPKDLRDAVWEAYASGEGLGTDELRAAQDAAIAYVNSAVAPS